MSNNFTFDGDEGISNHRRSGSIRSAPLRLISPGTFGVGVVLFFLPWTDLSCTESKGKMQLVTQSGFQSATGDASEGDGFAKLAQEGVQVEKKPKFDLNELRNNPFQKQANENEKSEKAPLLWLYLLLLIGGAIVPVLLPAVKLRGAMTLGLAGLAILVLIVQLLIGFPLPNTANEFNREMKAADVGKGDLGPGLNLAGKMEMKSSYRPAFYVSVLLLVASAALGLIQLIVIGPNGPRARRTQWSRDDDE